VAGLTAEAAVLTEIVLAPQGIAQPCETPRQIGVNDQAGPFSPVLTAAGTRNVPLYPP